MNHPPILTQEEEKALIGTGIFNETTVNYLIHWPCKLYQKSTGLTRKINVVFFWKNRVFFAAIDPNIVSKIKADDQFTSIKEFLKTHGQLYLDFPLLKPPQDLQLEFRRHVPHTCTDDVVNIDDIIPTILDRIITKTQDKFKPDNFNLDKYRPQ